MRIQVASDLHHEIAAPGSDLAAPLSIVSDVDLLVLAGDIHTGTKGVELYANCRVPVAYVLGDHEALGHKYPALVHEMKVRANGTSVRVLQSDEWVYDGVRILGTSLWTDYHRFPLNLDDALRARWGKTAQDRKVWSYSSEVFKPEDPIGHQRRTLLWLNARLEEPFAGKTVVVTHHMPSGMSVPQKNRELVLAAARATNVELLVLRADLWVHGHGHWSSDYRIGDCRVVCNPRGRPGRNRTAPEIPYENAAFNPALTIEL
ncbi:metallophosphoesterase [Paraburkholderia sp. IMGN_8]|uniref:metallophosphoesterase n=1 Tax=Paraburkholderia sp. IMGN_8 TaxID=3136564 RepID=UPI003100CB6E